MIEGGKTNKLLKEIIVLLTSSLCFSCASKPSKTGKEMSDTANETPTYNSDFVVVGGGAAGLMTALQFFPTLKQKELVILQLRNCLKTL